MTVRRVHVVGGGPAGLFAARLLALRHPDWRVRLHERNPPEETFGFAVGLTGGLLKALQHADPDLYQEIIDAAHTFSSSGFRLPQGDASLGRFHNGAISRARLLRLLLRGRSARACRWRAIRATSATYLTTPTW